MDIFLLAAITCLVVITISFLKTSIPCDGVGLTTKFSTSVISENLLFTSGLIALPLYSAMMAAFIVLKPIIVGAFSMLLAKHKDIIQ